jgi:hypothetical protein
MTERPQPSALYDWSMAIASFWLGAGIMIDAWYHLHNVVETFFEPAHGLLYAGLLASYCFTAVAAYRWRAQGYPLGRSLPAGYGATVAGLIVFFIGGIGDLVKHTLFGFEEAFNALVSPTHLLIGAGMFLVCLGPVCAALERAERPRTLAAQLPMLISAASIMELLHWGTQFVFLSEAERMNAPLAVWAVPDQTLTLLTLQYDKQGVGLLAVMIQSLLVAGFALVLARRIKLAPGALVVLLVAGNACMAASDSNYLAQFVAVILASIAAGIAGDAFRLDPAHQRAPRWAWASAVIPASYWIVLLVALAAGMGGLWWSPDVIAGSVIYAAVCGLGVNALSGPFARG